MAANLCQAANEVAIATANSLVSAATLSHWKAVGRRVETVPDEMTTTGVSFLSSSLGWTASAPTVQVKSTCLATKTTADVYPGVFQCILLSPAKMVEWMMVDSMPKLGQAPCAVC